MTLLAVDNVVASHGLLVAVRLRLVRAGVSGPLADAEAALLMSELFGSALLARALGKAGRIDNAAMGHPATACSPEPSSHVN